MAVFKPPCSCGHPHSLHDTGWDAAGCMHQSCSCRSYAEANLAFERRVLDDVELAALREENARLRQRVEEQQKQIETECCGKCHDKAAWHRAKRREAEAEVARLEGPILDWHMNEEDAPSWVALVTEARRIRAAKGE